MVILFAVQLSYAGDYMWPMKITPKLSSQFGDYRSGHWHAGIDITTRGKQGYKVYAVDYGYVYRIKTSFWGYGKALYLKLNDGRYAVYGHLARFDHDIEDYVRNKQVESRKYYQDLFFTPGQFPVKKGDYIALSGQSGAGAPHLHLEVRDKNNILLNPLRDIYSYNDSKPPMLEYLALKRFNDVGLGNYHEVEFLTVSGNGNDLIVPDTISAYGRMALSLSGYDPNGGYNYGLYAIDMTLNGVEIFAYESNHLDYASGNQIDYVRDHALKARCDEYFGVQNDNDKHVFYKLHIQPHDTQLFYDGAGHPSGIIFADSLDDGVNKLEITIRDVNDNSTRVSLYLKKAGLDTPEIESMHVHNDSLTIKSPRIDEDHYVEIQYRRNEVSPYKTIPASFDLFGGLTGIRLQPDAGGYRLRLIDSDLEYSEWLEFNPENKAEKVTAYADYLDLVIYRDEQILANQKPLDSFRTLPLPGGYVKTLIPLPVKNGYFAIDLKEDDGCNTFYKFNSGGYAYSPDSTVKIKISDSNLYDPVVMQITNPTIENGNYVFEVLPSDILFKSPAAIEVDYARLGINSSKASLYFYWVPKNKWVYIGGDKAGAIEAKTGGGGKFGIMADINGPYIGAVKPGHRSSTSDRTPYLSCKIEDQLSGIKRETQLEMTIDGIWVPAYYDIDTKEYGYQVRNNLRKSSHTLRITATDNQGNKTVKISTFTIR